MDIKSGPISNHVQTPILMYHSVSAHAGPLFKKYTLAPDIFREQMSYLSANHYQPITVSQYVKTILSKEALPAKSVLLTFDDGFEDFYSVAFPILVEFGFPCTLYVTTKYIGETSLWLADVSEGGRPMLNWGQLSQLVNSGIECGGHTHTHPQLDRIPFGAAQNEITLCKKILEDHLNREITSFAYPYGYFCKDVRQIVAESGYSSACAVLNLMNGYNDDIYALRRMLITANTNASMFCSLLTRQTTVVDQMIRQLREETANLLRRRNIYPRSNPKMEFANHEQ